MVSLSCILIGMASIKYSFEYIEHLVQFPLIQFPLFIGGFSFGVVMFFINKKLNFVPHKCCVL